MPRPKCCRKALAWGLTLLCATAACGKKAWTPALHSPQQLASVSGDTDYLKVHMRRGDVYVLRSWELDSLKSAVRGVGSQYDLHRRLMGSDSYSIPLDSIVLLEASDQRTTQAFGISWLSFWTTVYGAVSVICAANPKACFGSCPTFYVFDGERERLEAEGFSSSVAKVLEARDLDALYFARPLGDRLEVIMRNEALETHSVRRLRLHVAPRRARARVFATADGAYYPSLSLTEPSRCSAPEGDCSDLVRAIDALERTSKIDSTDLAVREAIYLDFPGRSGQLGLVLSARNTFVTTYVIYQSMAYMGSEAGYLLAQLERGDPFLKAGAERLLGTLGGITISIRDAEGSWSEIGEYSEMGPIASDVQLFRFESHGEREAIRVRLTMAKGSWRVDYAALAELAPPVEPRELEPQTVQKDGRIDESALAALGDPDRYLHTYPGDEYKIVFKLPESDGPVDFFLESQGYYHEWMRSEWLKEEDASMLALLLTNPEEALRRLAPAFKRVEPQMESAFWSSKFRR